MQTISHDIIIVGAGPGGSTAAALLANKGYDVAIVEREIFPRFKVGESLLPYSMDVLKKSGAFSKIDSGKFIRKYGAQFIDHRDLEEVYFEFENGLDQEHPYSFEVERAHFDNELLKHAESCGVKVYQPYEVIKVAEHQDFIELQTTETTFRAKYIADASGRAAVLGKQLNIRTRNKEFNNVAVFSHFENVPRQTGKREGDIIIGILPDKCWSWMIPFKNPTTSVGVVVDALVHKGRKYDEEFLMERLNTHPRIKEDMKNAKMLRPVQTASNYSEKCSEMVGNRWILLGDAATFLDPVFSTGVHVSLKSSEFASEVLDQAMKQNCAVNETELGQAYAGKVTLGVKRLRSLLRLFYDTDFVPSMRKTQTRKHTMASFTSVVGGDAWNDENELFKMNVL